MRELRFGPPSSWAWRVDQQTAQRGPGFLGRAPGASRGDTGSRCRYRATELGRCPQASCRHQHLAPRARSLHPRDHTSPLPRLDRVAFPALPPFVRSRCCDLLLLPFFRFLLLLSLLLFVLPLYCSLLTFFLLVLLGFVAVGPPTIPGLHSWAVLTGFLAGRGRVVRRVAADHSSSKAQAWSEIWPVGGPAACSSPEMNT